MKLLEARWFPDCNRLYIRCDCSKMLLHRADRKRVRCDRCGKEEKLEDIRKRWVEEVNKGEDTD